MEEKNEQIVEEIVESNQQDPGDENVVKETPKTEEKPKENVTKVDLGKFKSQEIESDVYKVDLSKPPKPEENETKEDNADNSGVVQSLKLPTPHKNKKKYSRKQKHKKRQL